MKYRYAMPLLLLLPVLVGTAAGTAAARVGPRGAVLAAAPWLLAGATSRTSLLAGPLGVDHLVDVPAVAWTHARRKLIVREHEGLAAWRCDGAPCRPLRDFHRGGAAWYRWRHDPETPPLAALAPGADEDPLPWTAGLAASVASAHREWSDRPWNDLEALAHGLPPSAARSLPVLTEMAVHVPFHLRVEAVVPGADVTPARRALAWASGHDAAPGTPLPEAPRPLVEAWVEGHAAAQAARRRPGSADALAPAGFEDAWRRGTARGRTPWPWGDAAPAEADAR